MASDSPARGFDSFLRPGAEPMAGYRLTRRLGRGGFGEVWEAEAPGGFLIALKFVSLDDQAESIEGRSLEILKRVRHPNLLTVFGAWRLDDWLIIGMELAEGTLQDRLRAAQIAGHVGIPRDELLRYLGQAAEAIDHLNEHKHGVDGRERVGIQHRDLKPQNLLLVGGGVKVADFGLAKLLENSVVGQTGVSCTVAYAAPEFFRKETSDRSDQYSLAVTYCQLRGGRQPFTGDQAQLISGHLLHPPDLTMLPAEERPAAAKALAKDPRGRWPSCQAFVAALASSRSGWGLAPPPFAQQAGSGASTALWPAAEPSGVLELDLPLALEVGLGEQSALTVRVSRDGLKGPIDVRFENLPRGLKLRDVTIPDGQDRAELAVAADLKANLGEWPIQAVAVCGAARAVALVSLAISESAHSFFEEGLEHMRHGRHAEAIESFNEAIQLDPNHARAYAERSQAHHAEGQDEQAIADFDRAVRLDPSLARTGPGPHGAAPNLDFDVLIGMDARAYLQRGHEAIRARDFARAVLEYDQAIRLNPQSWTAHLNRGQARLRLGDPTAAIDDFRETIRLKPDDPRAYNTLAWLLATSPRDDLRDGPAARDLAHRACGLNRWADASLIDTLAAACAEAGDFAQAVHWQDEALARLPAQSSRQVGMRARLDLYKAGTPYRSEG